MTFSAASLSLWKNICPASSDAAGDALSCFNVIVGPEPPASAFLISNAELDGVNVNLVALLSAPSRIWKLPVLISVSRFVPS